MRAFINYLVQMDYEQVTAWIGLLALVWIILYALRRLVKALIDLYFVSRAANERFEREVREKNAERLRKHVGIHEIDN